MADEDGEGDWDEASGAVFGPNLDDDDQDGSRDSGDGRVNGEADRVDMASVVVKRMRGLHRNHAVAVELRYTTTGVEPRLFYRRADGDFELLIDSDARSGMLPLEQLTANDVRLYVDSLYGPRIGFRR